MSHYLTQSPFINNLTNSMYLLIVSRRAVPFAWLGFCLLLFLLLHHTDVASSNLTIFDALTIQFFILTWKIL